MSADATPTPAESMNTSITLDSQAAYALSGDLNKAVFMLEALRNFSWLACTHVVTAEDLHLVAESFAREGGLLLDHAAIALGGGEISDASSQES